MKKTYEKPLVKGHKLQHNANMLVASEIDEFGMNRRLQVPSSTSPDPEAETVDEGW